MRNIAEVRSAGRETSRRTALKAVRWVKRRLEKYESRRPSSISLSKENLEEVRRFTDAAIKVFDANEAVRKLNETDRS